MQVLFSVCCFNNKTKEKTLSKHIFLSSHYLVKSVKSCKGLAVGSKIIKSKKRSAGGSGKGVDLNSGLNQTITPNV